MINIRNSSRYVIFCLTIALTVSCKLNPNKKKTESIKNCYSQAAVVTAHPLATEVGLDILRSGGNSFDAAIAVQFALAVVYPRAGNIAGGGFMVYRTGNGEAGALDFREKAPLTAHKDMYLDEEGNVIKNASKLGHRSAAVPGVVDGMWRMHEKLGALSWESIVQPSIELAENGYSLTQAEADKLNDFQGLFKKFNAADNVFISKERPWIVGDSIHLPDLAQTLTRIKNDGRAGFYNGETAALLLKEIAEGQGHVTQEDLDQYTSRWMDVIRGEYRGFEVFSMPPPSSGGIALIQLLKGAESYPIKEMGAGSSKNIHLMAELERRVYADRATHLGDPEFWNVPEDMLLDINYINDRNSSINLDKATDSQSIKEGDVDIIESVETTHFSIIDDQGNAVALTTTLNGNYGSKVMVDGAQFFLNNEMDDFSAKPGVPNMYGLVGGEANAIAPEKRMLSSMTPTIVLKDDEVFLILGTPGGSTIITSVFQVILNTIDHEMTLEKAIESPRWHHQWLPDGILYEEGKVSMDTIALLKTKGHNLAGRSYIGRVDAIHIPEQGCIIAVGDPRGDDKAAGY